MFNIAFDEAEVTVVHYASGAFTDECADAIVDTVHRALRASEEQKKPVQWIAIHDPEAQIPDADMRRRIIREMTPIPALHIAFVLSSPTHRAVMKTFTWFRTPVPNHLVEFFVSEADAIRWVEGLVGPRPCWQRMLREVQGVK